MPYCDRMKLFILESLEFRRKVLDLVLFYKIFYNRTNLVSDSILPKLTRPNRKHTCQIYVRHRNNKSARSFVNRTTSIWNNLNQDIVSSINPLIFRLKITEYLKAK